MTSESPFASERACPCGSGRTLEQCCQPALEGHEPLEPERVARARFTAFVLGRYAHLYASLHPSHPLWRRGEAGVLAALREAASRTLFRSLVVHDARRTAAGAQVLSTLALRRDGKERRTVELGDYVRVAGGWRYAGCVSRPGEEGATPSFEDFALTPEP